MDLSKIDVNFQIKRLPDNAEVEYYNAEEKPFKLFGLIKENGKFRRMPEAVAKAVSVGTYELHTNTSGGRVCFKTNSKYVALMAKMPDTGKYSHFSTLGSAGFDLYVKDKFFKPFLPEYNFENGFNGYIDLHNNKMKEITINFPLYSNVSELYIGLEGNAAAEEYNPYRNIAPIVYYGSSITQGGCASRPGNAYPAEIARRTHMDFINFGFSGSAQGETEMAEYIAGLDMSIFVMDYDYNAPTVEHLEKTHERFFKIIREKHKDLPVVFVSKPDFYEHANDIKRRAIVHSTYINAINSGDENVYFIDGSRFFGSVERTFCTVDDCHPNDMGFYLMAEQIGRMVKNILD